MVGEQIEEIIRKKIGEILSKDRKVDLPDDIIVTDNLGEVIEKLAILHCRMWYLEDAVSVPKNNDEIAEIKKKIDICFKSKRPKYVEAINRMVNNSIINGKSLVEDSVKHYKGFINDKNG